ncbi:MAG: GGDEF domain-containing protein [Chrysiogenetes bacterium]|nr:GGDEF domain-containing protein [Chrysiogenetes bacterium]
MESAVRVFVTIMMMSLTLSCDGGAALQVPLPGGLPPIAAIADARAALAGPNHAMRLFSHAQLIGYGAPLVLAVMALAGTVFLAGAWHKREAQFQALSRQLAMMTFLAKLSREREAEFRALSLTDPLTCLANRRRFMAELSEEVTRARRASRPMSLLMCDIDHFKKINDTYGHAVGDEVLRQIARALAGVARSDLDIAARVGGEEFAILAVETDLEGARVLAERIRRTVAALSFRCGGEQFNVTVSIGVTSHTGANLDGESLLEAADSLLYRAKNSGRHRVEAASLRDIVTLSAAS